MTWIRRLPKTRTRRLSRGKESLKDYFFEDLQKNSQKTYLFLSFFVTLHSSIETDTALQATSPIDFVRTKFAKKMRSKDSDGFCTR